MNNFKSRMSMGRTFQFFGLIFAIMVCILLLFTAEKDSHIQPTRLYLTPQGCAFMRTLGMKAGTDLAGCSVVARYRPGSFGSPGVILLDDDRLIEVSPNLLLGTSKSQSQLPDTPRQRHARLVFYTSFVVVMLMIFAAFRMIRFMKGGRDE
jgi:hypothetical protein